MIPAAPKMGDLYPRLAAIPKVNTKTTSNSVSPALLENGNDAGAPCARCPLLFRMWSECRPQRAVVRLQASADDSPGASVGELQQIMPFELQLLCLLLG